MVATHRFDQEANENVALPFRLRADVLVTAHQDPGKAGKLYYLKAPDLSDVIEFGPSSAR